MINYGTTYSASRPKSIEMTANKVFVASNIQPYETTGENDDLIQGYFYDFKEYDKDEYIQMMTQSITNLEDELTATKIILGVD